MIFNGDFEGAIFESIKNYFDYKTTSNHVERVFNHNPQPSQGLTLLYENL